MNLKCIGIALVAFASIGVARSQTQQPPTPKFEVISIKVNKSPDIRKGGLQFLPGGRFASANVPLIEVIAVAWNLPFHSQRLILAPGVRMPDDVYDIEATAPEGSFPQGVTSEARFSTMRSMLQALLEDRFHLRVRREPKDEPVYALIVGKDGAKLEKSKFQEQDCGDIERNWISNPACHFMNGGQDQGLHGESVTVEQVVQTVQSSADRPILDKTGITGYYNIQTEGWAPMLPSLDGTVQPGATPPVESDRPSLFDIFEKLGLKMESQRAIIDTFVIGHIEEPSPN